MHDRRGLGRELDIFDTHPLIGSGLPYWLPDGAVVRHALEEYVREAADGLVALRLRDGRRPPAAPAEEVLGRIGEPTGAHGTELWPVAWPIRPVRPRVPPGGGASGGRRRPTSPARLPGRP